MKMFTSRGQDSREVLVKGDVVLHVSSFNLRLDSQPIEQGTPVVDIEMMGKERARIELNCKVPAHVEVRDELLRVLARGIPRDKLLAILEKP